MIDPESGTGVRQRAAFGELAAELGVAWAGEYSPLQTRINGYDVVVDALDEGVGTLIATAGVRVHAPFINPRRFRFRCQRGELPSAFRGEQFHARLDPAELGLPDDWVIAGTDLERLRALLADPELRAILQRSTRFHVRVIDRERSGERSAGVNVDVLECIVDQVVTNVEVLRRMVAVVTRLLPMLNAQPTSPLEVPPPEVPAAFQRMVDELAGSLGGDAERVQDAVEARVPDPLGLIGAARAVVDLPCWPRMVSAMLVFEAPLLPGEERFTVDRRDDLCFWAKKTGDPLVDRALLLRGKPLLRPALLASLRVMAQTTPRIEVGAERMVLRRSALAASQLGALLGAAFDLWQVVNRQRAGEGTR